MTNPTSAPNRGSRAVMQAASFAAFILVGMGDAALGVVWPFMAADFNIPLDRLGLLLVTATTGFVTVSLFSGQLSDWLGIGIFLTLGISARSLGFLGAGLSPDLLGVQIAYLLVGAGGAVVVAGLSSYVAAVGGSGQMNLLHANFGLGATFGPLLATALLPISWRATYVVMAVLLFLLLPAVIFTRRGWQVRPQAKDPTESEAVAQTAPATASLADTLRLPGVWVGIMLFLCYAGVEVGTGNWAFTVLTQQRNIGIVQAGQWVSIYWGAFTIGRLAMGFLADRFDSSQLLRSAMLTSIFAVALWIWQPFPLSNPLALALLGLACAPVYPVLTAATPARLGRAHSANAIGLQAAGASLGASGVPALAGLLATQTSLGIIPVFILVTAVLMLLLGEVAALMARRRLQARALQQV